MNEEELFCKLFPEYVVNGKPLSPYFDLFQSGYEEAENKLKCCGNCKYLTGKFDNKTHINILFCKETDMREIQVGFNMCCKWEIKEK